MSLTFGSFEPVRSAGMGLSWLALMVSVLGIVWDSLGEYVADVGEERSSIGDEVTFVGRTSGFREQVLTQQFERRTLGISSGG
jgi:hypothetical protein